MKNRYLQSLITASLSICPIILIVFILSWTGLAPLSGNECAFLLVGLIFLIAGLTLFTIGASQSLSKVGEYMGGSLSKQKKIFIVVLFAFTLGTVITCAEPSIMIVTKQVQIPAVLLIGSIAVGVGLFVVIGILRIIKQKSLKVWYLFFYFITFMLVIFVMLDPEKSKFLPFIFDSGGVTTGSATVPFILSLGAGVAAVRGGKSARDDSFGLVGMASIGPIITMTLLVIFQGKGGTTTPYVSISDENVFATIFGNMVPHDGGLGTMLEVLIALSPILVIFLIYDLIFIKLPWQKLTKLFIGFVFSFIGLSLFLAATGSVMTPIGNTVGKELGEFGVKNGKWILVVVSFFIGMVTILCEPAVHVLTGQIVEMSDGRIKKSTVVITLSIGVGIAIGLAALRTVLNFSIMYIIAPGYLISGILMFLCPNIFTAMAFDSGGTASGPMSSSFVLPMIAGFVSPLAVAEGYTGDINAMVFDRAFGVVALIAMTPVIAIQLLGVYQNFKNLYALYVMRKHTYTEADAEIIHFN